MLLGDFVARPSAFYRSFLDIQLLIASAAEADVTGRLALKMKFVSQDGRRLPASPLSKSARGAEHDVGHDHSTGLPLPGHDS